MTTPASRVRTPRLMRLAMQPHAAVTAVAAVAASPAEEACELCGRPVPEEHRHVVDLSSRQLLCACRTCALLFDRRGAGAGKLRLIPDRRWRLDDLALDDGTWDGLRIPVEMAYFVHDSTAGRPRAFYPGPMGATESLLELTRWRELEAANPVLATLAPDVEALLVNRARGARRAWLVPLEDAYRLVAIIRTRWRGFTGGAEVWAAIDAFMAELDRRARTHRQPSAAPAAQRGTT